MQLLKRKREGFVHMYILRLQKSYKVEALLSTMSDARRAQPLSTAQDHRPFRLLILQMAPPA